MADGPAGELARWAGWLYETVLAAVQRRSRDELYHAALEVSVDGVVTVVEMTPTWIDRGAEHVVVTGPVGAPPLGRLRLMRYVVWRWPGGTVRDASDPARTLRLTRDRTLAARVLDLVEEVPSLTWGRDEAGLGDMWNSNSLVAWLLVTAGMDVDSLRPPPGGRAPGWDAGVRGAGSGTPHRRRRPPTRTVTRWPTS